MVLSINTYLLVYFEEHLKSPLQIVIIILTLPPHPHPLYQLVAIIYTLNKCDVLINLPYLHYIA